MKSEREQTYENQESEKLEHVGKKRRKNSAFTLGGENKTLTKR